MRRYIMDHLRLLVVITCILMSLVPFVATAADTAQVDINATGADIDISNTPGVYGFGTLSTSDTATTPGTHTNGYFNVTNNTSNDVDITIGSTNMTGTPISWILAQEDNPGAGDGRFALNASAESGAWDVIVRNNSPFNDLVTYLNTSATQGWGLQIMAPTANIGNNFVIGNVTLTATLST